MKKHFKRRLHQFVSLLEAESPLSDYSPYNEDGPRLYVSRLTDPAIMTMPREGTATVRYKIKSRTVNEKDSGPQYGADICISELEPIADQQAPKPSKSLHARVSAAYREFERTRNDDGQFTTGVAVSPDDMALAYQKKKKSAAPKTAGILGAAGLTAAALYRRKSPLAMLPQ